MGLTLEEPDATPAAAVGRGSALQPAPGGFSLPQDALRMEPLQLSGLNIPTQLLREQGKENITPCKVAGETGRS